MVMNLVFGDVSVFLQGLFSGLYCLYEDFSHLIFVAAIPGNSFIDHLRHLDAIFAFLLNMTNL